VLGSVSQPIAREMARLVGEKKIRPFIAEIYQWRDGKEALIAAIQQTGVRKNVVKV